MKPSDESKPQHATGGTADAWEGAEDVRRWMVLHLKPRCEKKLADLCRLQGLPSYLPLSVVTRVYQRRRVTFEKPLFPGYLFVALRPSERSIVLKSNYVVRMIVPPRQRSMLRQLVQVRRALRVHPTLSQVRTLRCGEAVRIVAGPLKGLIGDIAILKGGASSRLRVVLNVDLIGQAVAVEVHADEVTRV